MGIAQAVVCLRIQQHRRAPLQNLSGDPNQAYFSDGIAEEIRSSLTRLGGLTVIGSSSSEAVRNDDAKTAAAKLGVANILTGSVRESPSTIRVTAELIDGRSGADRWNQRYDRSPGDVIKIQTDIAENVASALKGALGLAARAAIGVGETQNPAAQRLLLQSEAIDSFSREGVEHGLELVDRAISLDPNYADAYALKARLLGLIAERFPLGSADAAANLLEAERLAMHALDLAPKSPAPHVTLATLYLNCLQFAAAKEEIGRALALAPNDPLTLQHYTLFLASLGNAVEALRTVDRLASVEPLSPDPHNMRALIFYIWRRYPDALAEERRVMRQWPDKGVPILVAQTLMQMNRDEEARQLLARTPLSAIRLSVEGVLAARAGNRAGAIAAKTRIKHLYGDAQNAIIARIDSQLRDTDQAIADLNRAWDLRDGNLTLVLVDPWLDPVRSDPRFTALIRKMNFPT